MKTIREWGANLLRFQIGKGAPSPKDGKCTPAFREDYLSWLDGRLKHLDEVLDWGMKYGVSIVVDLHRVPGGKYSKEESEKRANYDKIFFDEDFRGVFLESWRRIATRYKGRAGIYGYDLMNEPMQFGESSCGLYDLQELALKEIRRIDPAVTVIIETNVFDSAPRFRDARHMSDPNVVYSVHMYEPFDFTHQGVFADKPSCVYPDPAEHPYGEKSMALKAPWTKDGLRQMLSDVRQFQLKHGARIYVGEFSAAVWAKGAEQWLKDAISIFNEYGWDWSYHAFRESPCWSLEHEGDSWKNLRCSDANLRKEVVLDGLRRQQK